MHLPLVLCGTVCFLGTLLFWEGFRQNTMLRTETLIYEENISKYSNLSWNAENSRFPITEDSLCLYVNTYLLILPELPNLRKAFTQLIIPTRRKKKKSWTGVKNLFKYFRDSIRTQIKGNIVLKSSNSIRESWGLIALKVSSLIFFYQLLFCLLSGHSPEQPDLSLSLLRAELRKPLSPCCHSRKNSWQFF